MKIKFSVEHFHITPSSEYKGVSYYYHTTHYANIPDELLEKDILDILKGEKKDCKIDKIEIINNE